MHQKWPYSPLVFSGVLVSLLPGTGEVASMTQVSTEGDQPNDCAAVVHLLHGIRGSFYFELTLNYIL